MCEENSKWITYSYEPTEKGKPDGPHITNQFNFCCKGKSYSIQIFEILSGNGHDEYDIADENISRLKEGREDFWWKY